MSNQEILDQIAKFEKGLSNPNIPESTKNTIKSKIEGLKGQLEKVEEKVEKKEQKLEAEEKKIQSELEDNIAKWEKGLNNPNIPASAKEAIKKKIAAAKEEVAKQKAEIKEDKKESETEKKEVKAAVKKLAEVAKKAGKVKTKRKVVPKPEIKEDEREKKSEKRQSKLKGMMSELELLINKNKYLKSKYEGKGVDLERDASRPAKPFGYRFTGKDNFDVPTKEQIKKGLKDGSVDYEGRPNRSDKTPKKQYKLAHGGDVDNENAEMVLSKAKELEHHADELKNVVKPNSKVEAWEVAKMERAATDASDVTHYEDGKKMYMKKGGYMADGGIMASKYAEDFKSKYDEDFKRLRKQNPLISNRELPHFMMGKRELYVKDFISIDKNNFHFLVLNAKDDSLFEFIDKDKFNKLIEQGKLVPKVMADGGMMAKGGMTKKSYKTQGYDDKEDERLAMKHGKMANKDLKSTHARRDDAQFEERGKMANGGMMAKGGKLSSKAKYIPKRDIEEVEIDKNGKEKVIDGADLLDGIYVKKASYKKKVEKKASGGELKSKPKAKAKGAVGGGKLGNKGGNLANVVKLAKEIRKDGEKWTDAVKRASAQLKK